MFFILAVIMFFLSIMCFYEAGKFSNNKRKKTYIVLAIVCMFFAITTFIDTTLYNFAGYSVPIGLLPIDTVGEIVYIEETKISIPRVENTDMASYSYSALIKLPNGQLRLFDLRQKMELGYVKLMPGYQLVPVLKNQEE